MHCASKILMATASVFAAAVQAQAQGAAFARQT
jgi:hypothetical protein